MDAQRREPDSAEPCPSDPATVIGFAGEVHADPRECIALADQKATFWFAIFAGILGYLHSTGATSRWLVNPATWRVPDVLGCLAALLLLAGAIAALWAVAPRSGAVRGITFWRSIARFADPRVYAENVIAVSPHGLARARLEDCHALAVVCSRKYASLHCSIWLGFAGLVAALLYLIVS
jgi:hypothetical protein